MWATMCTMCHTCAHPPEAAFLSAPARVSKILPRKSVGMAEGTAVVHFRRLPRLKWGQFTPFSPENVKDGQERGYWRKYPWRAASNMHP